jgi:hypothetical protein
MERRKWAWAGQRRTGAGGDRMALAALTLEGTVAGAVILLALSVLAVARSVASVSYKDVLGKTVAKGRRGTATGLATSAGSAAVIGLCGRVDVRAGPTGWHWCWVRCCWRGPRGSRRRSSLPDWPKRGATEGGANGFAAAIENLKYLREDSQLRRFILARGLLTATALAPPYLVLLASGTAEDALTGLGALVLAGALAALVSGYVWGRLGGPVQPAGADGDRRAGGGAALTAALLLPGWALAGALFLLMLAHQGVRVGRSTHLVDMAPADLRAVYTALSNTLIGVVLLAGGIFGAIASIFGPGATIAVFAVMALGGAVVAAGLDETGETS